LSTLNAPQPRFIADVMVGRLARWLRILGFDVLYSNRYTDQDILQIAGAEERTILTRDTSLAAQIDPRQVVFIADDNYRAQVSQVLRTQGLSDFQIFSRCPECNARLVKTDKESVFERIPPYIYLTQEEFSVCPSCQRVYWHGTHAENMGRKVKQWIGESGDEDGG
jgi:uncharacterized protein with PIN domain